jgi:aminoglycoside 3-N-acetyltransferase
VGYIEYRELIGHLGISPGSLLLVTTDLTRLAMMARRKEGEFDIDLFIDSIQQHLGTEGTLVIPAFNFNLKNNGYYNPSKSLPITGALAVAALRRSDFFRTGNPLHSFLVSGRYTGALCALTNLSSFGGDSPFAFLKEHHAVMLLIDTSVTAAFTFVHHVEEMEKVRYREYRKISINIDNDSGHPTVKEFLLYGKKPGWTMALEGLEKLLIENQIARRSDLDQVSCTLVDLEAAYPLIKDDIIDNKAKNLARFSPNLYLREKAKSILAAIGIHTISDKISHDPGLL